MLHSYLGLRGLDLASTDYGLLVWSSRLGNEEASITLCITSGRFLVPVENHDCICVAFCIIYVDLYVNGYIPALYSLFGFSVSGTAREKARGNTNGLSQTPSKEKKRNEIKQEPLAVARLLLPTSNLLLPLIIYIITTLKI